MKSRFRPMVESPLTTLWEGWGVGAEGFGGGSYNHAWSGGPLIVLSQKVAGIAPLEPGYRRFSVQPQLGGLTSAAATVDSVAGEIKVEIQITEDAVEFALAVPPGTHAELSIPAKYAVQVEVDGTTILPQDGPSRLPTGLRILTPEGTAPRLEIAGGHWKVTARATAQQP